MYIVVEGGWWGGFHLAYCNKGFCLQGGVLFERRIMVIHNKLSFPSTSLARCCPAQTTLIYIPIVLFLRHPATVIWGAIHSNHYEWGMLATKSLISAEASITWVALSGLEWPSQWLPKHCKPQSSLLTMCMHNGNPYCTTPILPCAPRPIEIGAYAPSSVLLS